MEGLSATGIGCLAALLGAAGLLWGWRARTRRDTTDAATPLTLPVLPQLAWLNPQQEARWQRQVRRFLREKHFTGCAGQVVTDAQRALIAGMACLLRLQETAEREPLFPTVREVLLYPEAFLVPARHEAVSDEGLEIVDDDPDERIGEHAPGQVVLSWADVEASLGDDVIHVVVHEFAHALDSENPATEGAPPMADYREWSAVMGAEFARLQRHRRPPVLDPYGAESPAEFWCVVAEAFFQQPAALARHHPGLFGLLSRHFELAPPDGSA